MVVAEWSAAYISWAGHWSQNQIKLMAHNLSGSVRTEEVLTCPRGSSIDHRFAEGKTRQIAKYCIYRIQQQIEESLYRIQ